MKKLFFAFCLFALVCSCSAQKEVRAKRELIVKVKNWSDKVMTTGDDFWDNKKDTVIQQIGEVEYQKMLKNYDYKSIPEEMTIFTGKMKDKKALAVRLDQLKMYQIASFTHYVNGINHGGWVILRCPYSENKNWDTVAKWDTVYFIVKKESVEIMN